VRPPDLPEPHIGISKDTELDQDNQRQCQKNPGSKKIPASAANSEPGDHP